MNILISACLLDIACRFDASSGRTWQNGYKDLIPAAQAAGFFFIPVCPEQLGGLPTPRPPSELQARAVDILNNAGSVRTAAGVDVSTQFRRGAELALLLARRLEAHLAVLKAKSPSCGVGTVYSGRFVRQLIAGNGLTAELLQQHGMKTISDEVFLSEWKRVQDFSFLNSL